MNKTKLPVRIPLVPQAVKLLDKEYYPKQKLFKVISNAKVNDYLEEVIKLAGIKKEITFHCSRHTFATISLELGIPLEFVSVLLGHADTKTTRAYTKFTDNATIPQMEKWNKKAVG